MANFPATLYVLASSFPSFVASRPRSNAIRGTFSKTFHEGGYRSILFYPILIHNWGETTPTFLRICILDPSRNFFPFSAAWNEGGGVSILFAVKQYYVVKFMTASLALTMRPLGLCHGWKYQRYEKYERYSRCHPRAYDDPRLNGILPLPASFLISLSLSLPFSFFLFFFFSKISSPSVRDERVSSRSRLVSRKKKMGSAFEFFEAITHSLPRSSFNEHSMRIHGCFFHEKVFSNEISTVFFHSKSFGQSYSRGEEERSRSSPKLNWSSQFLSWRNLTPVYAASPVKIVQYSLPRESRECRCCARFALLRF